ncbi:MAG: (d)CMP kinase [Oscillospiraceae bacterium]|nr:(d)CMP kinase [Oscillospiraceae bacterium]
MDQFYSIAIDGPSGAGKSTIAKAAAKELGFVYLDTGAIYRTVAWHITMMGIGPKDTDHVPMLLDDANIKIDFQPDGQHMILNGKDITQEIRTPEIASVASQAAAQPSVREFLLDMQRDLAKTHNIIMDGRDIGTVVLPNASVKIYLTATPEARAMRRYQEYLEKGQKASYEEVLADQKKRDYDDSHRKIAPLKQAKDAVLVDTTEMDLQESINYCVALIREKLGL